MIIKRLSGGYLAAVYPDSGINRFTGKPCAEKIYGRDEEELKQRIRTRFAPPRVPRKKYGRSN